MLIPTALVVRETPSLADSVQVFLETLGFRVTTADLAAEAALRLSDATQDPVDLIVVACNRARSELLETYPEAFPDDARRLPVIVVGDPFAETRRTWPSNVKRLPLPLETSVLARLLDECTSTALSEGPPPTVGEA